MDTLKKASQHGGALLSNQDSFIKNKGYDEDLESSKEDPQQYDQENDISPDKEDNKSMVDDKDDIDQQSSKYQYVLSTNAYAILRSHQSDFQIQEKEVVIGRYSKDKEIVNETSKFVGISKNNKISRKAAKIHLNDQTEEFFITNLGKNAIMVDRAPLLQGHEKVIHHKSLLLIGDTLLFFLLPQEALDKKKRWLKERRKIILEEANILNPPKNNFDIQQAKKSKYGLTDENPGVGGDSQRKLKYGIGKRVNLKEMLMLQKYTKQQTMSQLGMSFLPPGTKPAQSQPQTLNQQQKK